MSTQSTQGVTQNQVVVSQVQDQHQVCETNQPVSSMLDESSRKNEVNVLPHLESNPQSEYVPSSQSNYSLSPALTTQSPTNVVVRTDQGFTSHADPQQGNRFGRIQETQQQKYFQSHSDIQGNSQAPKTCTTAQQPCGIIRTQQIFTPQLSQQRINVRHVLLHQGSQQHHIILQPQGTPIRSPLPTQKDALLQPQTPHSIVQWTPNSSRIPSQAGKAQQPFVPDPASQQWSIRSPAHVTTNVVYAGNQSNVPFVSTPASYCLVSAE